MNGIIIFLGLLLAVFCLEFIYFVAASLLLQTTVPNLSLSQGCVFWVLLGVFGLYKVYARELMQKELKYHYINILPDYGVDFLLKIGASTECGWM